MKKKQIREGSTPPFWPLHIWIWAFASRKPTRLHIDYAKHDVSIFVKPIKFPMYVANISYIIPRPIKSRSADEFSRYELSQIIRKPEASTVLNRYQLVITGVK